MKIFYICQRVPFPPDRGDKITTFNEIRHLARNHEVHVFCAGDGMQDLENVPPLLQYATSVTAYPVGRWSGYLKALAALLLGQSLSVAAYRVRKLHAAIMQKHETLRPDLMIVYSCNVAQYADHFPATPRIMQFADLDSLKFGQYAERSPIPLNWVYAIEQRRFLEYERRIARSFSHALVCTPVERRDFERLIPGVPVSLVGNGVDLEYFRPGGHEKKRASMVFTGVMDYLPNVDAVVWFCDEVLPLIQAEIPEATFTICGSQPAPSVRRLSERRGVAVTGRVPDTRPFMDAAEVFVAPLRLARGIQNKVLEALAMQLPCVCSVPAWGGTVIPQGEGILATDDPRQFAEYVIRLLREDAYRSEMAHKARLAAEANYSWEAQMQALDRVIYAVIGQDRPHSSREIGQ